MSCTTSARSPSLTAYPGLFSLIVKEMVDGGWASPMRAAEEVLAGGADHTLAGGIIAGGIYPFPEQAEAPTKGLFAAKGPELERTWKNACSPSCRNFCYLSTKFPSMMSSLLVVPSNRRSANWWRTCAAVPDRCGRIRI